MNEQEKTNYPMLQGPGINQWFITDSSEYVVISDKTQRMRFQTTATI